MVCDYNIELLFRGVTCVLGGRHVLRPGIKGVRLPGAAALIASLVLSLWVGQGPPKRMEERLCVYRSS